MEDRLLDGAGRALAEGFGEVNVADVTHDSRRAGPGSVFACVRGTRADGHDHAPAAVERGAVALLVDRPLDLGPASARIVQVVVDDVRAAMGHLASSVWGQPSRQLKVVGVTGTAAKTTTTHMIAAILEAGGIRTAVSGTLSGALTTPEATDLHRWLARLVSDHRAVAMEVSSHALSLHRVDGVKFELGVFTNLGVDHLDFHRDMDDYFATKRRLFEREHCAAGLICAEDKRGRDLLADDDPNLCPRGPYSLGDVSDVHLGPTGSTFKWRDQIHRVHLPGRFNVLNAVAACRVAERLGLGTQATVAGLDALTSVRGRFERIDVVGSDVEVVVDYSHKPDALAAALRAAREIAAGELVVVFGAGGDRDRTKRPQMGTIAAELADRVVVTSDNPRTEDPATIIEEIISGCPDAENVIVEVDRRDAIDVAVGGAAPGAFVVIAGKGHETTQTIGTERIEFDDAAVARAALERRLPGRGGTL
ncbi:MAG: UDP-N-acetylmuramoyl-L-alanyl-D-glutamate--2,6-diaminopimelate ligase [Actinomycetia bacterium]|nr:UDP-N-acetylmuramoyl-L-alanyl-D-glutamate--2,6-diaminopimelate ligase [Actinomycetes bacterium]